MHHRQPSAINIFTNVKIVNSKEKDGRTREAKRARNNCTRGTRGVTNVNSETAKKRASLVQRVPNRDALATPLRRRGALRETVALSFLFVPLYLYGTAALYRRWRLMHKLNRLAAKAAEYTGRVISLLASENEGAEPGGFLTRLPIAVLTRPLSSWIVARVARSAPLDRSFPARARAFSRPPSRANGSARYTDCLANDVIAANSSPPSRHAKTAFDPANFTLAANAAARTTPASIPFDSLCSLRAARYSLIRPIRFVVSRCVPSFGELMPAVDAAARARATRTYVRTSLRQCKSPSWRELDSMDLVQNWGGTCRETWKFFRTKISDYLLSGNNK